ncbi:hypothetical protein TNCV_3825221 [Trichonephila clavipes]|nr:hypothetical protein TNCV_3825221 [Trichonephila clavipes]
MAYFSGTSFLPSDIGRVNSEETTDEGTTMEDGQEVIPLVYILEEGYSAISGGPEFMHILYEVQMQCTLLEPPLAVGEESLPDSELILAENGIGVSDYHLTHCKRSDDLHLRDELGLWSIIHNVQDAFFHAWTAYISSLTNIKSGDVKRNYFTKLTT